MDAYRFFKRLVAVDNAGPLMDELGLDTCLQWSDLTGLLDRLAHIALHPGKSLEWHVKVQDRLFQAFHPNRGYDNYPQAYKAYGDKLLERRRKEAVYGIWHPSYTLSEYYRVRLDEINRYGRR